MRLLGRRLEACRQDSIQLVCNRDLAGPISVRTMTINDLKPIQRTD